MAKIRKAVFRNGIVMLSLLAAIVVGSSVAYAQECLARAQGATTARAEGMTEAVGGVEILCRARPAETFGFGVEIPDEITLSIELNTAVTNGEGENDEVAGLTYMGVNGMGIPSLGNVVAYEADMDNANEREVLSSDGMTISWKLNTSVTGADNISIVEVATTVTVGGIMANASALGDGSEVTAVVRVNGEAVHTGSLKLADVMTGLEVPEDKFEVASGLQCEAEEKKAVILFKEGFNSAFTDMDELVLNLRGVPEGVTVTASMMGTGMAMDPPVVVGGNEEQPGDLAPVTLMTGDDSGVEVEDGVATVTISSTGMGQVVYSFDDEEGGTDPLEGTDSADAEWNTVELTFSWEAGTPPLTMGSVTVSFHPVTTESDESPRFVAGPTLTVFEIGDCKSSLLFPFVTNMMGFDTGIAITNTSTEGGMCMLSFTGDNEPAGGDHELMVEGESVKAFGISGVAPMFQGYVKATCEFRNGTGYAFISLGGVGGISAAQGYLVAPEADIVSSQ